MAEKKTPFTSTHRAMMKVRNLKASNYEFVKETYGTLIIRDKKTGEIKILNKKN